MAYCKRSKNGAREGILQAIKIWSQGRPGNKATTGIALCSKIQDLVLLMILSCSYIEDRTSCMLVCCITDFLLV